MSGAHGPERCEDPFRVIDCECYDIDHGVHLIVDYGQWHGVYYPERPEKFTTPVGDQ